MSDAIRKGQRIDEFLDDPDVQDAIRIVEQQNYQLFKAATSDEGRRMAQAQAIALGAIQAALRAVAGDGERESIERDRAHPPAADSRP